MKITKILTIAALSFAAHGIQAQVINADYKNNNHKNMAELDMEMPLESGKKPFSYEDKSETAKNMIMPLSSSPEDFSYTKEEVKFNINKIAKKIREKNTKIKALKA